MEAILSVKVMRKGEEVSQFEKEEGVNMDGQTKKKYKEKEGLKSMIRYMRQRLFMNWFPSINICFWLVCYLICVGPRGVRAPAQQSGH